MAAKCLKSPHLSEVQIDNVDPDRGHKHIVTEANQLRFRQLLLEASNAFFAAVETQQPDHAAVCQHQIDATASALKKALLILEEFKSP